MKTRKLLVLVPIVVLAVVLFLAGCDSPSEDGTAFEDRWEAIVKERTETLVDVFFCTTTHDSIVTVIPDDRQMDPQTAEAVAELLKNADLQLEECTEQPELMQKSKTVGSLSVTLCTEPGDRLGVIITEDDHVFATLVDGRLFHAVSAGLFEQLQSIQP